MELGTVDEFISDLDNRATAIVEESQRENPAQKERDRLVTELTQGSSKDVWAKGQKKQLESMRAELQQMKFKAQALIDKTTTALLRSAQTIPTMDRTKSLLLLNELVSEARAATNKKRAKTARTTGRINDKQKQTLRERMLNGETFTVGTFTNSTDLGFDPSRSQVDALLKPLVQSGQVSEAGTQGKAKAYKAKQQS